MEPLSATSVQYVINNESSDGNDDQIRVYGTINENSALSSTNGHVSSKMSDSYRVFVQDPNDSLPLPIDDLASQDSDSIMLEGNDIDFDPSQPCWRHPKIRENWKMVVAATALFILGIVLLIIGIVLMFNAPFIQGLVFIIAGAFCFIPGAYHLVYAYLAVKGQRGYYFYHLPLFN